MIKGFFKRDPMINCHRGVHLRESPFERKLFFFFFLRYENNVGILNEERGYGMSDERKIPTCK